MNAKATFYATILSLPGPQTIKAFFPRLLHQVTISTQKLKQLFIASFTLKFDGKIGQKFSCQWSSGWSSQKYNGQYLDIPVEVLQFITPEY